MSDNREDQPSPVFERIRSWHLSVEPFPKADSLFSNFDLSSETYNKNGPKDDLKNTGAGPTSMVSNTVLRQSQGLFKGHGYGFGLEQSHQCSAELFLMLQRATFTSWLLPPPPSISCVHPALLTDYDFELGP